MNNQRIAVAQLSLPKGGGAIRGVGETFRTDEFTGTAALSIPIPTSPCRDSEPALSVDYDAGSGNGVFGLGFALSLPAISRKTSQGLPQYDATDVFLLSGAEDLVPVDNSQRQETFQGVPYTVTMYRPRIEGLFARIEYWQSQPGDDAHWRVIDSSNVTSLFGTSANARIADPQQPEHIFQWLLAETFDARGNHTLYEYVSEDQENVPATLSEASRAQAANTYIRRIAYGNAQPFQEGQTASETWHFELIFDYGEYAIDPANATPYQPVQTWPTRLDAFSHYQAGFEIRTRRLCQHILLFHRFEDLGPDPVLVHATRFHYQTSPTISLLQAVESIGFRSEQGHYLSRDLPLLQFQYTTFQPTGHAFETLCGDDGQALPAFSADPHYQFVDLYGEGIPGILSYDRGSALYWEPEGSRRDAQAATTVCYAPPQSPREFPLNGSPDAADLHLIDLTGNSQFDLAVSTPVGMGYYEVQPDHTWRPFRPLPAFPIQFSDPANYLVDMTGNGLEDVVLLENSRVLVYPSLGKHGFGPPFAPAREQGLPYSRQRAENEVLQFADLFGSGMSHLVRITNGRVECWPSLGYGHFGRPVLFDNAPHFGTDLDASRLFLADLDGSGPADIIYAYPDHLEIFFNQSGNAFSDPLSLSLPILWDRIEQIQFADVKGTGTTCLLLSESSPQPRHWCYDFCQEQKPYLLNAINNNLGARSTLTYRSSTSFYLADRRQGLPWIVNLPFPVQVVEKVEHVDAISQARLVSTYAYHHGYYDGIEREFRGFGLIERQDAETVLGDIKPTDVPPILTRTWYHTGCWQQGGSLSRQYAHEYDQQDPQAHVLPDSVFVAPVDEDAWREAARSLKGLILREEVFAPTAPLESPEKQQSAPYTVTETSYRVTLLQARGQNRYGIYFVHAQETLTYDYERDPFDPRTKHTFVLNVDAFGNVLRSCSVAYARRRGPIPEQLNPKITLDDDRFQNQQAGDINLSGIPQESRRFEIDGTVLLPPGRLYLTFPEVASYLDLERAPDPLFARLLSWQRYYYWSPTQQQAYAKSGEVSAQALLARVEEAVFTSEQIEQAFTGALAKAELDSLLAGAGGYRWEQEQGLWWNPGLSQAYLSAAQFFLPDTITDVYGNATTCTYDPHMLLLKGVADALKNQISALSIDYQTLSPQQIQDSNGNVSEVLFDPLGMVIVTSHYGTENGQPAGFMQLKDYRSQGAPGIDDIATHPENYLQGASNYFYYDCLAWVNHQLPVHAIGLAATDYPAAGSSPIQMSVTYSDGFGRELQSGTKVEPGEAYVVNADGTVSVANVTDRWLTTGRTVYNNKGAPVKQYEPYYIDTYNYIDNEQLNTFGVSPTLFYDPLERLLRVDTPKGFFRRTVFSAWVESSYDEDDTVKDSDYYQQNKDNLAPDFQEERRALQKAALLADTPRTSVLDTLGRTILEIEKQEGIVVQDAFVVLGLTGSQSQLLWQDLQTGGWLDWRGALTIAFQPDDPDFQLLLSATFAPYREQIIALLSKIQAAGSFLHTHYTWDIQGNQLASADPRLYAAGKENFRTVYSMTGVPLQITGVDIGVRWQLANVMGDPIYTRDTRASVVTTAYDALHRPVAIRVQGGDGPVPLDTVVQRMIYGDSLDEKQQPIVTDPEKNNLRGHLHIAYDQAGIITVNAYTMQGLPLDAHRQLRQEYKQEANWSDFSALLQATGYSESYGYDALGRITVATDADGNVSEPIYYLSGRLKQVQLRASAEETATVYIQSIDYNAKSQREKIVYGNGTTTLSTYEPTTFRQVRLLTTRSSDGKALQDLNYTYDPVGNIAHIANGAQEPVFNANQQVKPEADYTYNALYQLIQATGREHPGLSSQDEQRGGFPGNWIIPIQPVNNGQALENYLEQFTYDTAGNLSRLQHLGATAWTRMLTVSDSSNRAVDSALTGQASGVDAFFDGNGNQRSMVGLPAIAWNYRDNLASATLIEHQNAPSDAEYYVYDSIGKRVRKVTERYGNGGASARVEETIYLGTLEIRRVTQGSTLAEERHTVRIMDDEQTIATRIAWTQGEPPQGVQSPQIRYQLADHLGSVQSEVDVAGQLISYEEYFPYGGTALIAGRNALEVELKRYRYAGKERESATGLYYYGARYYIPWLGRWMNPDPAGTIDGLNVYLFVYDNPVTYRDIGGMGAGKKHPTAPHKATTPSPKKKVKGMVDTRNGGGPSTASKKYAVKAAAETYDKQTDINVNAFMGRGGKNVLHGPSDEQIDMAHRFSDLGLRVFVRTILGEIDKYITKKKGPMSQARKDQLKELVDTYKEKNWDLTLQLQSRGKDVAKKKIQNTIKKHDAIINAGIAELHTAIDNTATPGTLALERINDMIDTLSKNSAKNLRPGDHSRNASIGEEPDMNVYLRGKLHRQLTPKSQGLMDMIELFNLAYPKVEHEAIVVPALIERDAALRWVAKPGYKHSGGLVA